MGRNTRTITRLGRILAMAMLVLAVALPHAARAQPACEQWREGGSVPGVSGPVNAMTTWDPDGPGPRPALLVVGGQFTAAGNVVANRVAAWDGKGWQSLGTGAANGVNNTVSALAVYNGRLIAGGTFMQAGGQVANNIAAWDGTSWQPLGTGAANGVGEGGGVEALAVYDGRLIAGGLFTQAGGQLANYIAAWDDTSWQPLESGAVNGMSGWVFELTVYNGRLIAGGTFTGAGDQWANRIAAWDGTAWQSLGTGAANGVSNTVAALTVYNGRLIAGGLFTQAGGQAANFIASWDGTSWQSLGTGTANGVNNMVAALTLYNGRLIAGRNFTQAGGQTANSIAAWDGTSWQPLGTGSANGVDGGDPTSRFVHSLSVFNGRLIAGGSFTQAGGQIANRIAAWDDTSWQPLVTGAADGVNGRVLAFTVYNGRLIAGGDFTQAGGLTANRIAAWDGTSWQPLGAGVANGVNGTVSALTVYNGRLIAGGNFTQAGGQPANRIAAWDGSSWQSLGTGVSNGVNGAVSALTVYGDRLIAGGPFWQAGGQTAYHIAAWDGTVWQRLGTDAENGLGLSSLGVAALTLYSGRLIAGGGFNQAGGQAAGGIAAWDGTSWQPVGTGTGEVRALTVYNGRLIAGGQLAWDGISWQTLGTGLNSSANALTVYNGRLIAVGLFSLAGGQPANNIAAWDGTSWSSLGTGLAFTANALSSFDPDGVGPKLPVLVAGGSFGTAGGKVSPFFAVWGSPTDSVWSAPTGGNAALSVNWACSAPPDAQQTILFDRVAAGINLQPTYTVSTTAPITAKRLLANTDQVTLNLSGQPITLTGGPSVSVPPVAVGDRVGGFDARLLLRNTAGNSPATFTASGLVIGNAIDPLNNAVFSSRDAALTTRIAGSIEVGGRSRATLEVRDNSTLRYGLDAQSYLGSGFFGAGAGTTPNGTISVSSGGRLESATPIGVLSLGSAVGARSTTTITGTNSRWNAQQADLFIGDLGSASLTISAGGQLLTSTSNSVILGRQPTSSATVTINSGGSWTETLQAINIGGAGDTSQAAITVRSGGTLAASAINIFQGGSLSGTGTVQADVFNFGTLRPGESPGTLTIEGDYRQIPATAASPRSGKLELEVAGDAPGQADKLIVTGPTELGGGLFINVLNNYRLAPGSSLGLELVSAGVLDPEARFDVAYLPPVLNDSGVPDGRFLKVEYPPAAPLGIRSAGNITLSLGSLGSPITYLPPDGASVDGTPTGVAIGDLNGDGLDDLAISVPSSANPTGAGGSVVILINRGGDWQGFPSAGGPGSIQLATGREPRGVVIADLDNDGRKDLAVANASSDTVSLFANTTPAPASASFASAGSVSFLGRPVDLVADNFNGPDRVDLAVACEDANLVSVRRAVGVGFGFDTVAVSISTGNKPRSVAAFNPDQDKDVNRKKIAVANFASNTVGVINTSAGTVGGSLTLSPLQTINVAPGPVKVIAQPLVRTAGVNRIAFTGGGAVGQGRSVLVTVNQSAASSATASVIAPNPDPATQASVPFNPAVDIPAGLSPRGVIAADLDADLDDELVIVTNVGTSASPDYKLRVLRNDLLTGTTANQQLAFVFDRDIDAGVNPLFLVQGQLVSADPSAPRDLVTVNDPPAIASSPADAATLGQEPNIRPLRNRTMPPQLGCSPADIANTDGEPLPDGVIDNGDFTAFFGAFFLDQTDPARLTADIADTDGATTLEGSGPDGVVDNGDFTAFFNFFFQGCGIM